LEHRGSVSTAPSRSSAPSSDAMPAQSHADAHRAPRISAIERRRRELQLRIRAVREIVDGDERFHARP